MRNKIIGLLFALRIDLKKKKCTICNCSSWAVPVSPTSLMSRGIVTVVCNGCNTQKHYTLINHNELVETDSLYLPEEEKKPSTQNKRKASKKIITKKLVD